MECLQAWVEVEEVPEVSLISELCLEDSLANVLALSLVQVLTKRLLLKK